MRISTFNRIVKVWTIAVLIVWIPVSVVATVKVVQFLSKSGTREVPFSVPSCRITELKKGMPIQVKNLGKDETWYVTQNDMLEYSKVLWIKIEGNDDSE